MTSRRRAATARDRGAVMIEAALILPILLLIVFAVLELGMMYKSATVASSASRAGVRLASSTYALAPNSGGTAANPDKRGVADIVAGQVTETLRDRNTTDTPVAMRIYRATADGTPVGGNFTTCATDCLHYRWNGTSFVYDSGTWLTPDACGSVMQSIGVWVSVRHDATNSYIPISRTLGEKSVMRFEPRPSFQCTGPGGET